MCVSGHAAQGSVGGAERHPVRVRPTSKHHRARAVCARDQQPVDIGAAGSDDEAGGWERVRIAPGNEVTGWAGSGGGSLPLY